MSGVIILTRVDRRGRERKYFSLATIVDDTFLGPVSNHNLGNITYLENVLPSTQNYHCILIFLNEFNLLPEKTRHKNVPTFDNNYL